MLLEVLIGFTLFAVVVLATGTGTMFTTVAASAAQQRSVAYSLVSADIANVTALPFADLTAGLNHTTDSLGSDPNIQTVGATYVLRLTGADPGHLERQHLGEPACPAHIDDHARSDVQGGDVPAGHFLRHRTVVVIVT